VGTQSTLETITIYAHASLDEKGKVLGRLGYRLARAG